MRNLSCLLPLKKKDVTVISLILVWEVIYRIKSSTNRWTIEDKQVEQTFSYLQAVNLRKNMKSLGK